MQRIVVGHQVVLPGTRLKAGLRTSLQKWLTRDSIRMDAVANRAGRVKLENEVRDA